MNKPYILFTLSLLVLLLCACNREDVEKDNQIDISQLEDVSIESDFVYFKYSDLERDASIIAKVEVIDDLTANNSLTDYMNVEGDTYLINAMSKRKIRILEYYKNDSGKEQSTMEIIEGAAIVGKQFFHDEEYTPLEKGKTYILYLSNETSSGEYSLMSGLNSVIDLDKPFENKKYVDIAVKTIINYESDLPVKEKQALLKKKMTFVDDIPDEQQKDMNISVDTYNGEKEINISYANDDGDILIEIDN
ncbi:MAG: hypothetical protein K6G76_00900 [Lachnospiraceae bacterium]|nr:hypothetical protein [Lachnospiraceae bacterium]